MLEKKKMIGYHCDIARGNYLKPAYFKKVIQLAAESGFTHFFPYLENMIQLPTIEKACPSCAYTPTQWSEFEHVANTHDIELVPHFNVIGHTEKFCLAYPKLASSEDALSMDVTRSKTKDWMLRCLGEFCEFSKAKHFLIGGDEWQPANDLLRQECFDVADAWVDHINLAIEFLVSKNRVPIVWHDMLMHYPKAMDRLSKKAVVAFWFYDEDSGYPVLKMLKQRGFRTIMASGQYSNGETSNRRFKAIKCALAEKNKHDADGFMMTDWQFPRWETITPTLHIVGSMLQNISPPSAITTAFSLYECLSKVPANSPIAKKWQGQMKLLLNDNAWTSFPECRAIMLAEADGDRDASLKSYLQYHYAQGPLYESLCEIDKPLVLDTKIENVLSKPLGFGVTMTEHPHLGDVLRVVNDTETFVIYPKFGATLQDWKIEGEIIIGHSLPSSRESNYLESGGYRSYSSVGGLRPIWALGTHHNPCILNQYPYQWKMVENTDTQIIFELWREFYHVDVCYVIQVVKGQTGFSYRVKAVNKLDEVHAAFNFNLPLVFDGNDIEQASIEWDELSGRCSTTIAQQAESFFVVPAPSGIAVKTSQWTIGIVSDSNQTAGYYVDWGMGWITPDMHGIYHPLKKGDVVETCWGFTAHKKSRKLRELEVMTKLV